VRVLVGSEETKAIFGSARSAKRKGQAKTREKSRSKEARDCFYLRSPVRAGKSQIDFSLNHREGAAARIKKKKKRKSSHRDGATKNLKDHHDLT